MDDSNLAAGLPSDEVLRSILRRARTVAVVGLSSKPDRASYQIAEYLQRKGYRVIPVNPHETEVLGQRAYPTLDDLPPDVGIDIVDVFRRPEHAPGIAEGAVRVGAKVLWLQEGIVNEDARRIAEAAGMTVVMGTCIKHTRERLEPEG